MSQNVCAEKDMITLYLILSRELGFSLTTNPWRLRHCGSCHVTKEYSALKSTQICTCLKITANEFYQAQSQALEKLASTISSYRCTQRCLLLNIHGQQI